MATTKDTMKAVVFKGKLHVEVEERPIPKIQDPKDIVVKVRYTALCGRYCNNAKQKQSEPPKHFRRLI